MSAVGFGEFHPVGDNTTPEGRQQNRRVVVAIAKHPAIGPEGPVGTMDESPDGVAGKPDTIPVRNLRRVTELPGPAGLN